MKSKLQTKLFRKNQKHRQKKIDSELDKEEMLPPKMQKIVDELMGMKVPEYVTEKKTVKIAAQTQHKLGSTMVSQFGHALGEALFKGGACSGKKMPLDATDPTGKSNSPIKNKNKNYEIMAGNQIFSKLTDSNSSITPAAKVKHLIQGIADIKQGITTPRE